MSDLVERLRAAGELTALADRVEVMMALYTSDASILRQAAAALEAAQAEIDALRADLSLIERAAEQAGYWPPRRMSAAIDGILKVARRAKVAELERANP